MKHLITLALLVALTGCSANATGTQPPTHWRTFHGIPVAIVNDEPVFDFATMNALGAAGYDLSNMVSLRARVLRESK